MPLNNEASLKQVLDGFENQKTILQGKKNNIASAITSKGVTTSGTESFDSFRNKINSIVTPPKIKAGNKYSYMGGYPSLPVIGGNAMSATQTFKIFATGSIRVSWKPSSCSTEIRLKRGDTIISSNKYSSTSGVTNTLDVNNIQSGDVLEIYYSTNSTSNKIYNVNISYDI